MNVSFGDGVKTSTREQNNVRFSSLCHDHSILSHPSFALSIFCLCYVPFSTAAIGEVHSDAAVSSSVRQDVGRHRVFHWPIFKGADAPLGETRVD